jgi:lipoprotein-anchoring transpeptidase ErfK/SrfK
MVSTAWLLLAGGVHAGQPGGNAPAAPAATTAKAPASGETGTSDVEPATIEAATLQAGAPADQTAASLVKLEVLLDRAHDSPGVIDGRPGENLDHALAAFAQSRHLAPTLDSRLIAALGAVGGGAITARYTVTDKDEAGPFIGHVPSDFYAQSKLEHMGYTSPEEELAERFHMSPKLLEAMNPGVDFSKAGTEIEIVRPHEGGLGAKVARIEVDKSLDQVRAYGPDGALVASFPSTIGSADHPAPAGRWAVAYVRYDPTYVYDPRVLTWGPKRRGRFTIAAGPNNPTGVVWIALTKPTYGIHGTPNAELVGKTASHGCVRLTNWDAWDLALAVTPRAPVVFVEAKPTT